MLRSLAQPLPTAHLQAALRLLRAAFCLAACGLICPRASLAFDRLTLRVVRR